MPRETQPAGQSRQKNDLRSRILKVLAARPLDKIEISKSLGLPPDQRAKLRGVLRDLEIAGEIVRVRKDRYVLPKEADLVAGIIQFHANGSAHILTEKSGQPDLAISGLNTFTAMHGDRVVARISADRPPGGRGGPPSPARPGQKEGTVIRILERATDVIVGTLQKSKNFFYVVADDPRFTHHLYVPEPKAPLLADIGDKVVAKLDAWTTREINPEGHIVEVLGAPTDPGVDMLSIIRKHRLPVEFPEAVTREAKSISTTIRPEEIARREDRRGHFVFTIDPDDARDFDDAIEVERTNQGWKVGIHIADVSHFVQPKSALDEEAYARGNSVYLADRVIPMLPEALSNGLCSLRPDEDHLTFSVFAEISSKGKVISTRFAKTIIRSVARLTYKQAFAHLQKPAHDLLTRQLHTAWELSSTLRKKRFVDGSLDLDFAEIKVILDPKGKPIRIEKIENDISHQLIEELMLLANEMVARELLHRREPTVYRVHEKPDADRLAEYRETVMTYGMRCGDLTNRQELQNLLARSKGTPHEYAIRIGLLKSLKRARYAPEALGHYGLSKADYTHFTSPIRRYADLLVHRSLEHRLGLTKKGPDSRHLTMAADHISTTERSASDAEKDSVKLKKLEFFQNQMKEKAHQVFKAKIVDVRNFGFFVELPDALMSGLVHVSALENDFFILDTARASLVGRKSRKVYKVGGEIDVVVARVDVFKQQVDFAPAIKPHESRKN